MFWIADIISRRRHHLLVVFCEIALASLTVVVAPLLTLYKLFWITIPLPCLYCKEQPAIKQLWTILSRGKQSITLGLKTRTTHWNYFPLIKRGKLNNRKMTNACFVSNGMGLFERIFKFCDQIFWPSVGHCEFSGPNLF